MLFRSGKTDVLTPTDRFAPRDYLNVVGTDFLAVNAARLLYGGATNTLDLVWSPRFTPSRVPLLNQRWVVLPEGIPIRDLGAQFPGGSQFGARWNHIGARAEYALSFYDGFNHLPLIASPSLLSLQRYYPRMRMYGFDAVLPFPSVAIKIGRASCRERV